MNKYYVRRGDVSPSAPAAASRKFEIAGDNLADAINNNFSDILNVSSWYSVPFKFPITVSATYYSGLIGGQGGVLLELEWMYSESSDRPATKRNHKIAVYANPEDLPEAKQWVVAEG